MPREAPLLSPETLVQLRSLVSWLHAEESSSLPAARLVELASSTHLPEGLTIDFQASRELGQPLVVLRPPEARPAPSALDPLSPREREIAGLLAEGLTNKEIGKRLGISLATVKDHVHRMLVKTCLPNRAAVAAAYRSSGGQPHSNPGTERSQSDP